MIKIEIESAEVRQRNKRDGSGQFRVQEAYLHREGQKYPERFDLPLGKDGAAHTPGMYTITPDSFRVWGGRLEFWPRLEPWKEGAKVKAA